MDDTLALSLQAWLARRSGAPVQLLQTHISWVLLAGRLAFKLKKPVRLPFLDFSTPQQRGHFCEEELRLNRRLAPSVYRRVIAVRGSAQSPRLGGAGPVIDHVVCMRRFPDDALLERRVREGRVTPEQIDRFALRLADFHRSAPVVPPDQAPDPAAPVWKLLDSLPPDAQGHGAALRHWGWLQAQALEPVLRERARAGAVREVHGDLHLGNIVVLGDDVTAFDAIEFDPALRRIDVMSDVAFTMMDLAAHGRGDLAFRFLDGWLQSTGDFAGLRVLPFYLVHRATVRAAVRRFSPPAGPAPDYLGWAGEQVHGAQRPWLALMCGPSGSGKSAVALQWLQAAGAARVRSDVERKRLHGMAALDRGGPGDATLYGAAATELTYARLRQCAKLAVEAGFPAIVDAASLRRHERDTFRALARELDVPFRLVVCEAPEPVLRERVALRGAQSRDPSDATVSVLQRQLATWEAPGEDESPVVVDTTLPLDVERL